MAVLCGSGRAAAVLGREGIESDFPTARSRERALETYHLLDQETRDVYDGFAAGINRYIDLHPEEFPQQMPADFTGYDVAALDISGPSAAKVRAFLNRINPSPVPTPTLDPADEEGAGHGRRVERLGIRTEPDKVGQGDPASQSAPAVDRRILRSAHDRAGRRRFLRRLSHRRSVCGDRWIQPQSRLVDDEQLAGSRRDLRARCRSDKPDHYLFDGTSLPLNARSWRPSRVRNGDGFSTETREFWSTPFGPVVHRANGKIYIIKIAGDGEFRAGEQFLRMMRASSLAEWKEAMKMRARPTSNFTYADRAGNIYFLWNASLPLLPHPSVEDTVPRPVRSDRRCLDALCSVRIAAAGSEPAGRLHTQREQLAALHERSRAGRYDKCVSEFRVARSFAPQPTRDSADRRRREIQPRGCGAAQAQLSNAAGRPREDRSDRGGQRRRTRPAMWPMRSRCSNGGTTPHRGQRGSTLFEEWWATYSGLRRPERQTSTE